MPTCAMLTSNAHSHSHTYTDYGCTFYPSVSFLSSLSTHRSSSPFLPSPLRSVDIHLDAPWSNRGYALADCHGDCVLHAEKVRFLCRFSSAVIIHICTQDALDPYRWDTVAELLRSVLAPPGSAQQGAASPIAVGSGVAGASALRTSGMGMRKQESMERERGVFGGKGVGVMGGRRGMGRGDGGGTARVACASSAPPPLSVTICACTRDRVGAHDGTSRAWASLLPPSVPPRFQQP